MDRSIIKKRKQMMKEIMSTIFIMLLSGNSLFVFYMILEIFFKKNFSFCLKNIMLKLCLVLFVVPISYPVFAFRILLLYIYGTNYITDQVIYGKLPTIIITPTNTIMNIEFKVITGFVFVWIIGSVLIFLYNIFRYIAFKKRLKSSIVSCSDQELRDFLDSQRTLMRIKQPIELLKSSTSKTAYTTGLFRPYIIIPSGYSISDFKIMIRHELTHVKQWDMFFKFFCFVIRGVYWFNPLIYLFLDNFDRVNELACDESVSEQIDFNERIRYSELIIIITAKDNISDKFSNLFSKNNKFLKERIDCIMKNEKQSILKKIVSGFTVLAMVLISCIPAIANPVPQTLNIEAYSTSEAVSLSSNAEVKFDEESNTTALNQEFPIIYDDQFTTDDGEICEAAEAEPKMVCTHTFKSGVYSKHVKKSNGGCTTKNYSAQKCTKCGALRIGDLTSEYTYTTCPH